MFTSRQITQTEVPFGRLYELTSFVSILFWPGHPDTGVVLSTSNTSTSIARPSLGEGTTMSEDGNDPWDVTDVPGVTIRKASVTPWAI